MGDCKKCPFYKTEPVPENLAGKVNLTEWPSCDVDAVGLAAADRIEAQAKEIEKLRGQNEQLRKAYPPDGARAETGGLQWLNTSSARKNLCLP